MTHYVACDPDTKKASYAIIDEEGKLVDAWCINSKDLKDSAKQHSLHIPEVDPNVTYISTVESQQFYPGDTPAKVKSLLTLARACGISMMYIAQHFSQPELILPHTWSRSRTKKQNQFWLIKKMGMTVIECAGYCAAVQLLPRFKKTEQKHLLDAVCIAQFVREQHQKKQALNKFKQSGK